MNLRKLHTLIAIVLIGVATLTSHAQNRSAKSSVNTEVYELRIYFDYVDLTRHEPQIKTQIKVGALFFAKSESKSPESSDTSKSKSSPSTLYIASGVLHISKEGKFTLEHAFLDWWSPTSNFTYASEGMQLELDRPQSVFSSDGIIHGYTVVLSRVTKMRDPQSNNSLQVSAG